MTDNVLSPEDHGYRRGASQTLALAVEIVNEAKSLDEARGFMKRALELSIEYRYARPRQAAFKDQFWLHWVSERLTGIRLP